MQTMQRAAGALRSRTYALLALARYASSLAPSKRVLVLHGKGGSGPSFEQYFEPIARAMPECEFRFLTAPYPAAGGGAAWWTLPPGVRSFDAKSYEGVDVSLAAVADEGRAVDAIWGHSQGAILLGAAAARCVLDPEGPLGFLEKTKLIVNGASWPKPYESELAAVERRTSRTLETLHVLGTADDVNPPEHAVRLATVLRGEVFTHAGGHYVPTDDVAIARYRAFLLGEEDTSDGAAATLPEVDDAPGDMVTKLFAALSHPSVHATNATLDRVWDISGESLKWIFNNDRDEFVQSARETADTYPTSFYGSTMRGKSWRLLRPFEVTASGWIGTSVVETVTSDGRLRRWICECRQRRRPPDVGTWYIESIGSSAADGTFHVD